MARLRGWYASLLLMGVLLALLLGSVEAKAGAASFCKCICGTESQIIALNPADTPARRLFARDDEDDSRKRRKTCNDCNRQFCLDYNLPKCRELPAEKVTTRCFQRDSSKDQAIILIFMGATISLLGWAIIRPWASTVLWKKHEHAMYAPVAAGETAE